MGLVTLVLRLWFLIGGCQALLEGLYCGTDNCYDVLGVDREASKSEIGRAYRKLAVAYHPDKYKGADAKEKFLMISTAYEVLKDEEERANYDYMLDNPDLFYAHYYNYYRKRVGPKVDIRVVIATTVVVISILQYLSWWHSYNQALKYALGMPKYRMKVKDIAKERKLLPVAGKKMSKEEAKSQEEAILWSILEENLDITGGYRKPHVLEVLLFKILLSPYHLVSYLVWYASWVWRFSVKGESYGPQEEAYLTRRKMKLSLVKWEAIPEEKREEWLGRRLWEGDNYELFKEEQEEEQKAAMAENNKYKKYRRYMKNHGVGRMTFAE